MDRFSEDQDSHHSKKELKTSRKIISRRDRSQHKKTDSEKRGLQKQTRNAQLAQNTDLLRGRVLSISPEGISVQGEEGIFLCSLKGSLKKETTRAKNLVAVGDFVLFEWKEVGVIVQVEERSSVLARLDHLHRKTQQLLAANIDQVLITVSVVSPPLKPPLVDRYIIASFKGKMNPIIVVNKIDLLEKKTPEEEFFHCFIKTYEKLKIPVIPLSAKTGMGMDRLKEQMKDKASVFSGQSGVGKSSLINTMTGLSLSTGPLAIRTQKGVHTTSSAHLIPLEFGGWCIDTPGIRSFGVWDLTREDLALYFPEIFEAAQECHYPNCTHTHEPHCALEKAIEEGKISSLRFYSYLKLLEEILIRPLA